jgi:hypothetical protein
MCVTVFWGAHESFMHPIFVLKNGCDNIHGTEKIKKPIETQKRKSIKKIIRTEEANSSSWFNFELR